MRLEKRKRSLIYCGADQELYGLLLPVAAALGRDCEFTLSPDLMDASMSAVLRTLKVHGIKHEVISRNAMRIWGKLTAGTFIIPSRMDPSFLSGLLFALPLLKENSVIMIDGPFIPDLNVNLTLKAMEKSGITTEINIKNNVASNTGGSFIGATFKVPGGQQYSLNPQMEISDTWPY